MTFTFKRQEIAAVLRPHDPADALPVRLPEYLRRDAQAIIETDRTASRREILPNSASEHTHRIRIGAPIVLAAAAVTALLLVTGLIVDMRTTTDVRVVTPQLLSFNGQDEGPPAGDRLLAIAERARNSPPAQAGKYDHLVIDAWYLNSQTADGQTSSAIVPERREVWRAADGSGRIRTQRQTPEQVNGPDWDSEGSFWYGSPDSDVQYDFGEYEDPFDGRPPSSDPATFGRWVTASYPASPTGSATAVAELHGIRALLPAERATALEFLSGIPGIYFAGSVTDRAGRAGEGFSVDSREGLPETITLIIDPADGKLLGVEKTLTEDAGNLNVSIPAVVSYETFRIADFSSTPGL